MKDHSVCLILGSNIEPERHLPEAVTILRQVFPVEALSHAWQSPSVGAEGPDFLNLAVMVRTPLDARTLKDGVLRQIEAWMGRTRTGDKNAPRTIDIDIITWDGEILDPEVWQRAHLAVPVAELIPCAQSDANGEYLEQAAQRLSRATPIRKRNLNSDESTLIAAV